MAPLPAAGPLLGLPPGLPTWAPSWAFLPAEMRGTPCSNVKPGRQPGPHLNVRIHPCCSLRVLFAHSSQPVSGKVVRTHLHCLGNGITETGEPTLPHNHHSGLLPRSSYCPLCYLSLSSCLRYETCFTAYMPIAWTCLQGNVADLLDPHPTTSCTTVQLHL